MTGEQVRKEQEAFHEPERGCPTRSSFAWIGALEVREVLLLAMRCGWDSRAPFKGARRAHCPGRSLQGERVRVRADHFTNGIVTAED
jgi:hypothetical protein